MCSPSNSFGNLFRWTPTVLHDMGPFWQEACLPCVLPGWKTGKECRRSSLTHQAAEKKTWETESCSQDWPEIPHYTESTTQRRRRRTKKSKLGLKTWTNYKEAGRESQWIFGSVSITGFKVFDQKKTAKPLYYHVVLEGQTKEQNLSTSRAGILEDGVFKQQNFSN